MSKSKVQYLLWVLAGSLGLVLGVLLLDLIPDRYLEKVAPFIVLAMAPAVTVFPVLYLTFYRWYKNPVGRALMTKAVGFALLIDVALWFEFVGDDTPYREAIKVLIYLLILFGLWYQLVVFIRIKLDARREERDLHDGIPSLR